MSDELLRLLEEQPDLKKIKPFDSNGHLGFFKVVQKVNGKKRTQSVRVVEDIQNHYAVKREKDVLNYLNQFSEFIHFNEIRKVGFYYLQFFDFVGKKTLAKKVKKKGGLSANKARQLLSDMVAILDKVHHVGFVHGNIQPESIILGKKRAYLADCSHTIPSLSSYETEKLSGELSYCPPERLNGRFDEKSDIYMLGCTLYFALTGKHIYRLKKKDPTSHKLWAHVHHTVHQMNKLPIFWRYLIFWMTQKDPDKRPSLDELRDWIDDVTVPDWVRKMSVRADKSYPKDPLTSLADEHYLYPIYLKAQQHEKNGDLEMAFNLYENGAFRDYSLAENSIGKMYEKGMPVKQSFAMAANMYHQAFQKGHPDAAFNLARFFEKGLGMPANVEHAFKLYRYAALRGHLDAQNALAMMYVEGRGTQKDMAQARSWLGLAANSGSKQAKANIRVLLKKSKEQLQHGVKFNEGLFV